MSLNPLSSKDKSETKTILYEGTSEKDIECRDLPSLSRNNKCKWAVLYFFLLQGTCVGVYSSQVSVFKDALGISDVTLGAITSLVYVGYVAGAPVSAGVCRSVGSKKTVLTASQFFGLNFAIVGIAGNVHGSNVYLLAIAFFLFGFAMGMMDVAGNSQGILVEVLRNVSCFGLFHGSYAGAVAIGTIAGGVLLYICGDVSSVYICALFGILLASLAIPFARLYLYDHDTEKEIEKSKKMAVVSHKKSYDSSILHTSAIDTDPSLSTSLLPRSNKLSYDEVNDVNGDNDIDSSNRPNEPLIQCLYPTGVLRMSCLTGFLGSFAEGGFLGTITSTYIHTYIHTYTHTYIHTYIHTYVHTYIHTYIRTYIHT